MSITEELINLKQTLLLKPPNEESEAREKCRKAEDNEVEIFYKITECVGVGNTNTLYSLLNYDVFSAFRYVSFCLYKAEIIDKKINV